MNDISFALTGLDHYRRQLGQCNNISGPDAEKLLSELEHQIRTAYGAQAEVGRLESIILNKTAENNGQQHEMAQLLDEVRRRDSTIECLQEANRSYMRSVTLEGKDELPDERDALVAMIFSLRADRKRLEGEVGLAKGQLLNAQQEADDAKERFSLANADYVAARETNEKLLAKIEEGEKFRQMALKSQDLQAAQERVASLERETQDQQVKLEAAVAKCESMQRALHEATGPMGNQSLPPMRYDPQPRAEPLAVDQIRPANLGNGELPPPPSGAPPWAQPQGKVEDSPSPNPSGKPSSEGKPLTAWE